MMKYEFVFVEFIVFLNFCEQTLLFCPFLNISSDFYLTC